jgi:hypothetical protein
LWPNNAASPFELCDLVKDNVNGYTWICVQEANSGQPGILITFDKAKVTTPDSSSNIRYLQCASYEALKAWDKVRSSKRDLFISGTDANDKLKTIAPNVYKNISKKVYFTGMFVGEYKKVSYANDDSYLNYDPYKTHWTKPYKTGQYYGKKRIQTIANVKYHILELSNDWDSYYERHYRGKDLIFFQNELNNKYMETFVHYIWDFDSYWKKYEWLVKAGYNKQVEKAYQRLPETETEYNERIKGLISKILSNIHDSNPLGYIGVIQVSSNSLAWHWSYGSIEWEDEVRRNILYPDINRNSQSVSFQASESVTKMFTKINL